MLDDAVDLPIAKRKESEFPVSRRAVTHLAHAIARLRAGLMRINVLACGDHPMLDGSYAVMHAQCHACSGQIGRYLRDDFTYG